MNYDGSEITRTGFVLGLMGLLFWPVVGAVALFIGLKVAG